MVADRSATPGPKTALIGPKRMSRQQFATKIEAPANALRQGRAGGRANLRSRVQRPLPSRAASTAGD